MSKFDIPYWKEAPFLRVLLPFVCGIVFSYYCFVPGYASLLVIAFCALFVIIFSRLNMAMQYSYQHVNGVVMHVFIGTFGIFTGTTNNPYESLSKISSYCSAKHDAQFIVSVTEPPQEKKKTWKALAGIDGIKTIDGVIRPHSFLHIYFKKDSAAIIPHYGSRVLFNKKPERIKNSPVGSKFNYQEYCAIKNIHYQVFLRPGEFIFLEDEHSIWLNQFVFSTQHWVTSTLKRYITNAKECGLAEALLIGYRNDLDRQLVQSYSNTGVVHVVAISGLHLGLVYGMLNVFCRAFDRYRLKVFLTPMIVLLGLWTFTLLAGASPSVLRSAVMFSFIVVGKAGARQSSLLNNLAVSAFFLLCYEPYWLWDLGFILSYSALLSIAIFMNPIYYSFIPENKLIGMLWKMTAVTMSAQILTMPVLIYYFGQFPNLFLLTNFVAIPLSSIILCGLIALCFLDWLPAVAGVIGQVVTFLIKCMNEFVRYVDGISFNSTKDITITFLQLCLLYAFIAFIAGWLIRKHKPSLYGALISLIVFFLVILQPFKETS